MEGPSGSYRPDTGGKRAGQTDGQGVREWQKNTWFGPTPLNSNPFDEPEDAPELKEIRSENVNEHMGEFWQPHNAGYNQYSVNHAAVKNPGQNKTANTKKKQKKRRFPLAVLVFLLTVTAVLAVLRYAVFTVGEIRIIGNDSIPAAEIIRLSGIRQGAGILSLDEKKVSKRISSDCRLQFSYMSRQLPHTVILCVREREACCWLSYCGIIYVMDKSRMVMYETEDPTIRPANLVEVKGLSVRSTTHVGQEMLLTYESQQNAFSALFLEMKVLGCTDRIKEADMTDPDSILLETRDGYTVSLGNAENLHAKLRSMLLVQEELQNRQMTGGTINVSNPESPIYNP